MSALLLWLLLLFGFGLFTPSTPDAAPAVDNGTTLTVLDDGGGSIPPPPPPGPKDQ